MTLNKILARYIQAEYKYSVYPKFTTIDFSMPSTDTSSAILQLEETLIILQESLLLPWTNDSLNKKHIARLKQLYSPLFDFEHSESGSYYHAALQCIKSSYIDDDSQFDLPLPPLFVESIMCLIEINTLSLDTKRNKNGITEAFINLANLWHLQHSQDMADLLSQVIVNMRRQVTHLLNNHLIHHHEDKN